MDREHADKHSHRSRPNAFYWRLDLVSEYLIYVILVFTPWAFGTTEDWAIQTVNLLNYVLGGLLVVKWITRLVTGFYPPRWDAPPALRGIRPAIILAPLAVLTVAML